MFGATKFTRMLAAGAMVALAAACADNPAGPSSDDAAFAKTTAAPTGGRSGTTLESQYVNLTGVSVDTTIYSWTLDKSNDEGTTDFTIAVNRNVYHSSWTGVTGQACERNGGGVATQDLTLGIDVYDAATKALVATSPVSVASNPVLDPLEWGCYSFAIAFTPVDGATYFLKVRFTITNHSGNLGIPTGPAWKANPPGFSSANFTIPATTYTVIGSETADLSDSMGACTGGSYLGQTSAPNETPVTYGTVSPTWNCSEGGWFTLDEFNERQAADAPGTLSGSGTFHFSGAYFPGGPCAKLAEGETLAPTITGQMPNTATLTAGDEVLTSSATATMTFIPSICQNIVDPPPPDDPVYEYQDFGTGYGFLSGSSTAFCGHANMQSNNWGWSTQLAAGSYTMRILVGAAGCTGGTDVGSLTINFDGSNATVTYALTGDNYLDDVQLWAGSTFLPVNNQGKYSAAPGGYNNLAIGITPIQTYTFNVSGLADPSWFAAHAHVVKRVCVANCGS